MKVICIDNTANALPRDVYLYSRNAEFQITIGKEYTVYGIATFKRFPWYLVCEDHYDFLTEKHPKFICSTCFNITDGRLSRFWKIGEDNDLYNANERTIIFGFSEMLDDPNFYSRLLEGGEAKDEDLFIKIKNAMDNEFYEL